MKTPSKPLLFSDTINRALSVASKYYCNRSPHPATISSSIPIQQPRSYQNTTQLIRTLPSSNPPNIYRRSNIEIRTLPSSKLLNSFNITSQARTLFHSIPPKNPSPKLNKKAIRFTHFDASKQLAPEHRNPQSTTFARKTRIFYSSNQSKNPGNIIQARTFSALKNIEKPNGMDPCSSPNTIPVVCTVTSPFANSPLIDASSSIRKPLTLWPGTYHSPVTNALWEARSSIFERLLDPSKDGPPQIELLTKTPSQSRTGILYNFSTDYILREHYRNPWNGVRIGKLLEDLDALAGTIAMKHCTNADNTTRPLLLVTASVDKMVLKKPLEVDMDLKVAGAVTWIGRSSIEIRMEVTQSHEGNSNSLDSVALTANFTFVARDSKTGKSAPVNRLLPESEREKMLFEEGEVRDRLRKRKREHKKESENGGHNLHVEGERLKALLSEGRVFCDMPALADRDSILMSDTRLENSLICQPQQRNLHGRIFGGFLIRRAFELAFSTSHAFVGQVPCFLEVDHVDFLRPVDVGDFLRFKSCVLYTQLDNPEQPLVNINVEAHVMRPQLRTSEVSNTFYFTFTVRPDTLRNGLRIRNVVPATEEEARRVLKRMDAENTFFTNL